MSLSLEIIAFVVVVCIIIFAYVYIIGDSKVKSTKNLPEWLTVDYENIWETKLSKDYIEIDCDMSEYTYGHIFKKLHMF